MSESKGYRISSFGVVVETKPPGTDFILVSPMEELHIQDTGLIKEQGKTFKGNKKQITSVNFHTEHESKNYIRAKWYDISGGNRLTAPDVVVNETVLLFKYGNVDEYFWCTLGREPELRRLEDVLYGWSNLRDGIKAYDKKSSYWLHVSTRDKFVHFHSSNNDGEFTTFDIKLDTKVGNLKVWDGVGNSVEIASNLGTITQIATKEIIRKAPKITDISQTHTVNTDTLTNNVSGPIRNSASVIVNSTPIVQNKGNVSTAGVGTANFNMNARCICPNCV